jgi:predicted alpha/beta superfamily hydrolase
LSGSFAIWLNYFDRRMFENYIIASPNAEYGITNRIFNGEIFNSESSPSQRVMMSMDRSEFPDKQFLEPDALRLSKPLREMIEGMKGYDFRFHLTEGESHASAWFVSLPTGLRFIYGSGKTKGSGA